MNLKILLKSDIRRWKYTKNVCQTFFKTPNSQIFLWKLVSVIHMTAVCFFFLWLLYLYSYTIFRDPTNMFFISFQARFEYAAACNIPPEKAISKWYVQLLRLPLPAPRATHEGRIIRKKNGFSHTTASSVFYGCILTRQRTRQQAISLRRGKFWRNVRRDEMIDVGGVNFRAAPVEWCATHGGAVERGWINDDWPPLRRGRRHNIFEQ